MGIIFRSGMSKWAPTRDAVTKAGFVLAGPQDRTFKKNDVVLNWGCLTPCEGANVVYNLPDAVRNCCDKERTLTVIGDMMPKVYDGYSKKLPLPFVMKKNHTHKGHGKRKISAHTLRVQEMAADYDIFQEWLDIKTEYRVLCLWDGKRYINMRVYEKVKNGKPSPREIFHPSWDFVFRKLDTVPVEVRQAALKATSALKMQFAGLDVALTDKGVYIIEVNSAPGLGINCATKLYGKLAEAYPKSVEA